MTCGDMIAFEYIRPLEKFIEFHKSVAVDARVRSHSAQIRVHKSVYDFFSEIIGKVEHEIRHSEFFRNASCVLNVIKGTACVRLRDARVLVIIQFHRTADAGISPVNQYFCGNARINAAAHCDKNFHIATYYLPRVSVLRSRQKSLENICVERGIVHPLFVSDRPSDGNGGEILRADAERHGR